MLNAQLVIKQTVYSGSAALHFPFSVLKVVLGFVVGVYIPAPMFGWFPLIFHFLFEGSNYVPQQR